jgi:DNA-binding transcriptional regulator LsrR (DeoR family)
MRSTLALAACADIAFVGIGEMDETAPLFLDGFMTAEELAALRAAGAVGEICGWIYDSAASLVDIERNLCTASAPLPPRERATVVAIAKGRKKLDAIRAAVAGGLVNALITDEATAKALLGDDEVAS